MKKAEATVVPSNSWRTAKWIMKAYGIEKTTFLDYRKDCLASEYKDAIIQINKKKTFIREDLWQKFLRNKSDKYLEEHYGI